MNIGEGVVLEQVLINTDVLRMEAVGMLILYKFNRGFRLNEQVYCVDDGHALTII